MSKGYSGLFSGTVGFGSSVEPEKASQIKTHYEATEDLKNHIENPEPTTSGNDGIKGATIRVIF